MSETIEKVENQFLTSGRIDAAYLRQLAPYMTTTGSKILRIGLTVAVAGLMVGNFFSTGNYLMLLGAVAYTALMIFLFTFAANHVAKTTIKQFLKDNPEGYIYYSTSFGEDEVFVHNDKSDISGEAYYLYINKMVETSDHYTLFTKSNQYLPVFKSTMSPEMQEAFKAFIQEKCIRLKIIQAGQGK